MCRGWCLEPSPSQRHCWGTQGLHGTKFENHSCHSSSFKSKGPWASLPASQAHPDSPGARKWGEVPARHLRPQPQASDTKSKHPPISLSELTGTETRVLLPKAISEGQGWQVTVAPQLQVLTLPGYLLCARAFSHRLAYFSRGSTREGARGGH